jgi:prevent-host-death family protein
MTSVGSYEAKTHLPRLLDRVAKGEKITITKNGKPVAMLVPLPPHEERDIKKVIEEFRAYSKRQGRTLGDLTFREMIEEGRRY